MTDGIETQHDGEIRIRITDTGDDGVAEVGIYDTFMTASIRENYGMTESGEIILTIDGGDFEVVLDE